MGIHLNIPCGMVNSLMPEAGEGRSTGGADFPEVPIFFEGMAWPVPLAFAHAILSMRFEQGDVLYRDAHAYDLLEGKIPKGLSAIQVILPKRSARATPSEFDGDRRRSSWQSEVTVELIDLASGETETRVLTQGKLAMAIFRGDDDWLDPEREEPPMLRSARELHQRLGEAQSGFDLRQGVKRGCRFIFVVDLASDASRSKAAGVEEALRATGSVERSDLSAELAGIENAQDYHPSAVVRCLVMPNRTTEDVLPILRRCLYGGASDDSVPSEGSGSSPDRFSVGRHGLLQTIPTDSTPTRSKSSRS